MIKIFQGILIIVVIGAMITGLFFLFESAIKETEIVECKQWQSDSEKFEGWYSLEWQRDQCAHYEMELK